MFRTKKRFGQHFLKDQAVLSTIAEYCGLTPDMACVEIGPGQGALTHHLLKTKAKILAIELDQRLVPTLENLQNQHANFDFKMADVLTVDFSTLFPDKMKVVGNLPYEISTPLLFKLIEEREKITQMVFLLQKEVVDRMVASVGSQDYGRLSVMTQYYFKPEALLVVPKEAFNPPPKVTSQVVRLTPLVRSNWVDHKALEDFVKDLFSNRRKMLRQKYKGKMSTKDWEDVGIDSERRPQTLTLDEILQLFKHCQQ